MAFFSSAALNLEDTDTEQGDLDKVNHTVCLVCNTNSL